MSQHEVMSAEAIPEQVGLSFLALAHDVRERLDRHMVAAAGISLARTKVLQVLAAHGTLHQAELADALGQAPRSVTQIVEGLERGGLIARTGDPDDRRRKTVFLTEKGRTALTAAERAGTQLLRRLFGSLDRRQLAALEALLARIETADAD
ncbi:MarR family winged helix-turn-helix transcriptional regulator [Streptomyces sp. A012304]|uniref:MarR family winged helix-turn-helix transcriptional regulator n=1 Tax=Streptomyces sp. A012304 TaxID=375446 RepID=UPI00223242A5|nr:MarR family winged helix-turn-helix transcriptional regulator [Streptomyces sp. A012304]GKQ34096.1 MarR family transcriptional regulator [Streptomyces sp. A012304]